MDYGNFHFKCSNFLKMENKMKIVHVNFSKRLSSLFDREFYLMKWVNILLKLLDSIAIKIKQVETQSVRLFGEWDEKGKWFGEKLV